jgi:hypothetical protein
VLTRIFNSKGFIIEPPFRFDGFLVDNLVGSILVPIVGLEEGKSGFGLKYCDRANLLGIWVGNFLDINPIFRFLVIGVIDLFRRIDSGYEFLKETPGVLFLSIYLNDESVVRTV